jgi:TPR repeat protein
MHPKRVPDLSMAFKHILTSAEKGYMKAQLKISEMYITGTGCQQDMDSAIKWLERCGKTDNPEAWNQLGSLYLNGYQGHGINIEKAKKLFLQAASAEHTGNLRI